MKGLFINLYIKECKNASLVLWFADHFSTSALANIFMHDC